MSEVKIAHPALPEGVEVRCRTREQAGSFLRRLDRVFGQDPTRIKHLIENNPGIEEVMLDATLSDHQRKLKMRPFVKKMHEDMRNRQKEIDRVTHLRNMLSEILEAMDKQDVWRTALDAKPPQLEKNEHSRLHKLFECFGEAVRTGAWTDKFGSVLCEQFLTFDPKTVNPFVVQHDWAAAFANASDYHEGGWHRLPFEMCAFEFRISGQNVIILANQDAAGMISYLPFIEFDGVWSPFFRKGQKSGYTVPADKIDDPVLKLVHAQIKAISIALEAEVAFHDVVRAPAALNKKRESKGELPLYDYRVVKLNRESKAERHVQTVPSDRRRPRLHFRRGHWRHYEAHNVWIKWMLVGDPELGYIDKEYRL